jgi:hypothetical protein
MEDWNRDFESLRLHILKWGDDANHPAIVAALKGLDQEIKRRDRDTKLQQKFTAKQQTTSSSSAAAMDFCDDLDDTVKVEKDDYYDNDSQRNPIPKHQLNDNQMHTENNTKEFAPSTDDWQDVTAEEDSSNRPNSSNDESSYLGSFLAKEAVTSVAAHVVRCSSPHSALAVIFHAALLKLGFVCTGIPEDQSSNSGGFAQPIRELPASQFLPLGWEAKPVIQLRYRKHGMGATVLTVQSVGEPGSVDEVLKVSFIPSNAKENKIDPLAVAVQEHINFESWRRAIQTAASVAPALHYKLLPVLLTRFVQHFEIGTIDDELMEKTSASINYIDYTMLQQQEDRRFCRGSPPSVDRPDGLLPPVFGFPQVPPGLHIAPPVRPGDFSGDLTPVGMDPFGIPRNPGNLLGPNHPMFSDVVPGTHTWKPRYDPVVPWDTTDGTHGAPDPDGLLRMTRPPRNSTRPGEPNNDQLKPPHLPGNNMFM